MYVDVSSTILHGPQNMTVFSRSTVNFRCTSDIQTVIYWKYAESATATVTIFDHHGRNEKVFDARFVNTVNGTTTVLTIRNVQKSDAGSYMCHESHSHSYRPAQLMVTG